MTDKLTARIAKLLAQSEGAGTEAEATVFLSKAQELATLHSIDLARARHATREKERTVPVQRTIVLGEPRARGLNTLVELVGGIARANDVKYNIRHDSTAVIAYGYAEDIDIVEALYASLAVQMAAAAAEWKKNGTWRDEQVYLPARWVGGRLVGDEFKPISWLTARLDFQLGFAHRIGQRLAEAKQSAEDAAKASEAGNGKDAETGTALVLIEKAEAVSKFYEQTSTARRGYRGHRNAVSAASTRAGRSAGTRARLYESTGIGGVKGAIAS